MRKRHEKRITKTAADEEDMSHTQRLKSGRLTSSTTSGCSKSSPLTGSLCLFAAILHQLVLGSGLTGLSLLSLGNSFLMRSQGCVHFVPRL